MKNSVQKLILALLFGVAVVPAYAFNSLYVFGDSLSATADNQDNGHFYNHRWSNGRVWVEVLAQRQGLVYDATKNNSHYDQDSADVVSDVLAFKAPADVAKDLFVVWVCNADTFNSAGNSDSSNQWTLDNTTNQINNLTIITNLYAKGVLTLIMPNAVDISRIPAYNADKNDTNNMHNGCIAYNTALANTINSARLLCPGLTIYTPDFYTLLNNILTNAPAYGLTNALSGGLSIDAYSDFALPKPLTLNGPGANYIFWDPQDPTAKLHEIIADVAQQMISPVQISQLTVLNNGSNRLDVANYPAGLNGKIDGSTNLTLSGWSAMQNITSTNTTASFFFAASPLPTAPPILGGSSGGSGGPGDPGGGTGTNSVPFNSAAQFYRMEFPFAWSWP